MHRKIIITIGVVAALITFFVFFRYTGSGSGVIWSLNTTPGLLFPLVLIGALLDSINPCAFSVLLLTIAFLLSLGKLRTKILSVGGFYVLGIFAVYLLIGVGLLQTLHLFNTPHFMAKIGSALLIVVGLVNLAAEFIPRFPIRLRIPTRAHHIMATLMDRASLPAAFLLGAVTGLCEFPCTGGPYLAVLGLLHDRATYTQGVLYLISYNLIFVLPLILILVLASDRVVHATLERWQGRNRQAMRVVGGLLAILLGLIILAL